MPSSRCRRRCARLASIRTSTSTCRSTPPFRDEAGPDRPPRRLFRQAAGRPGVRLLRLPDAVHAGDQRPVERAGRPVARRRARTSRSSPSASIRATRRRRRRPRKRRTSSATSGPAPRPAGTSSPATQPSIERLTQAAGFRYAWDERHAAVRAPDRHHRADAGRPAGAVPVRHRVRAARSAARRSSRRRPARSARRSTRCCSTAITTTR